MVVVGQTGNVLLHHEAEPLSSHHVMSSAIMGQFMQNVAAGTEEDIYRIPL